MALSAEELAEAGTGVCAPRGFRAGTAAGGIRGGDGAARDDIAVIRSDLPCGAAGVFTRNAVKAAPVVISQLTLRRGRPVQAVVLNSGNANACTGAQGFRDALLMCSCTADSLDLDPSEVLVCSTGLIGHPLPMERVTAGIRDAARSLSLDGTAAARAIMTTDTRPKLAAAAFAEGERAHAVGGIAKGAGMIHPDMATMLAVLTTDAAAPAGELHEILRRAVDGTFNCLTVDGDTSTNDTVLLLANGAACAPGGEAARGPGEGAGPAPAGLERAVHDVCESLAEQIVADGEGASRRFRVTVSGAVDAAQARAAARTVAGSTLVKTAVHGRDPNWGRIVAALGRSGATFTLDRCRVSVAGVTVFDNGAPVPADETELRSLMSSPSTSIDVELGSGTAAGHAWGCELTEEYVSINADYTT